MFDHIAEVTCECSATSQPPEQGPLDCPACDRRLLPDPEELLRQAGYHPDDLGVLDLSEEEAAEWAAAAPDQPHPSEREDD